MAKTIFARTVEKTGKNRGGTNEDERTILFKTISLDGIKPNTNPNPKLTLILTLFSCFMLISSTVL